MGHQSEALVKRLSQRLRRGRRQGAPSDRLLCSLEYGWGPQGRAQRAATEHILGEYAPVVRNITANAVASTGTYRPPSRHTMSVRYCGRTFTPDEIEWLRGLIGEDPSCTRADLSWLACRQFNWLKADAGLKIALGRGMANIYDSQTSGNVTK